jgi:hypothetical protein
MSLAIGMFIAFIIGYLNYRINFKVLAILLLLTTAARADTTGYLDDGTYVSDATVDDGWLDVGLDGDEPVTDTDTEIYDDAEDE